VISTGVTDAGGDHSLTGAGLSDRRGAER